MDSIDINKSISSLAPSSLQNKGALNIQQQQQAIDHQTKSDVRVKDFQKRMEDKLELTQVAEDYRQQHRKQDPEQEREEKHSSPKEEPSHSDGKRAKEASIPPTESLENTWMFKSTGFSLFESSEKGKNLDVKK